MSGKLSFFLLCALLGAGIGSWWTAGRPLPVITWSSTGTQHGTAQNRLDAAGSALQADNPAEASTGENDTVALAPDPGMYSYNRGIMKVAPAVVSLYAGAITTDSNGQFSGNALSQGSGVIVGADGIILTNLHLVEGHDSITVVLSDGSSHQALLIGSDRETDLAVVRIDAGNLPYVALDAAPPLQVGDIVLAIGNPFGVGQTVTQGIVSATHRRIAGASVWQHFVQIDAAINPGNSGGALINPHGQLVGVNTAVFRSETGAVGIGFAIPADLLAQVVPQIIEHGSVARGWLGVALSDSIMWSELPENVYSGALIRQVLDDSPASEHDLRMQDIIIALNGRPVRSATQLLLAISLQPPDTPVTLTVLRKSADSKATIGASTRFDTLNITLQLGDRELARQQIRQR